MDFSQGKKKPKQKTTILLSNVHVIPKELNSIEVKMPSEMQSQVFSLSFIHFLIIKYLYTGQP